jgi:1,4-dihydroxy-2-naphthoate octaprenyltransferase
VGALITAILVVNNLRDESTDRAAGKRTLAVRFGNRVARREYFALLAAAYAAPVALAGTGAASRGVLLTLASLPLAIRLVRDVGRAGTGDGALLNRSLVGTARLVLVHGVLLAAGIAV